MNGGTGPNLLVPIATVVVSGLFALLGGFVGALLTRRTEYKKWLRQERGVVFSDFLKRLNEATQEACAIVFDGSRPGDKRDQEMTDIFCRLNGSENVVRLYLRKRDREAFSKLLIDYWNLHFQGVENERRIIEGKRIRESIQDMLEETLHI